MNPRRTDFYLPNRAALADVTQLMARYGARAEGEAAARANRCRSIGNLERFCHWRQIGRAIAVLRGNQVTGSVH